MYQQHQQPSSAKYEDETEIKPLTKRDKRIVTLGILGILVLVGLVVFVP